MAHIFVSYDAEDRDLARAIVAGLEAAGWSVWWDRRIPAGKTWRSVLDKALEDMDCMLVLWSARSIDSHWVIEEAEEGRARGKLLPLLIEPVRPPRGFREIQALSFVDWDRSADAACFRTLVEDLSALTGEAVRAPPGGYAASAQPAHTAHVAPQAAMSRSGESAAAGARAPESGVKAGSGEQDPPSTARRGEPAAAKAPTSQPSAATAGATDGVRAARDPRARAGASPATGPRKLAVAVGVAAVCVLAIVAFLDRSSDPDPEALSREEIRTPEAGPSPAPQAGGTSLVAPPSTPLVNSSSPLLAPAPTRERSERPGAIAPLVQGNAPGGLRGTPELDRFEQQREERRRQRQAEIERKLRDMKGSPEEIERARIRLEIDAANEEQAEMTRVLDEMNRQAMEAIRSIKP